MVTERIPAPHRPPVFVTVDVEGDDQWTPAPSTGTKNARSLPRFHDLCRRYGLRPVYLTSYEMATSREFQALAREAIAHGEAEIGAHPHAWSTPPFTAPATGPLRPRPYLTQFDEDTMRRKIGTLTCAIEDAIGVPVRSHRGGRWAFNEVYARLLAEHGYTVDASVTPHVSWRQHSPGDDGADAPDYTGYPENPYFLNPDDIRIPGSSTLLEVPMTTCRIPFDQPAARERCIVRWMRPNGRNRQALMWLIDRAIADGRECLVLMLHSSELMPGGSPGVPRAEDVEALHRDLDAVFARIAPLFRPLTLTEFHAERVAGA